MCSRFSGLPPPPEPGLARRTSARYRERPGSVERCRATPFRAGPSRALAVSRRARRSHPSRRTRRASRHCIRDQSRPGRRADLSAKREDFPRRCGPHDLRPDVPFQVDPVGLVVDVHLVQDDEVPFLDVAHPATPAQSSLSTRYELERLFSRNSSTVMPIPAFSTASASGIMACGNPLNEWTTKKSHAATRPLGVTASKNDQETWLPAPTRAACTFLSSSSAIRRASPRAPS